MTPTKQDPPLNPAHIFKSCAVPLLALFLLTFFECSHAQAKSSHHNPALDEVNENCRENEKILLDNFNADKKKASRRSLKSMNDSESSRNEKINEARKKYARKLKALHAECDRARKEAQKKALPPAMAVPPAKKAERKPAALPPPPPKQTSSYVNETASPFLDRFHFGGSVRQEVAYRISEPRQFTKNRTRLLLNQSFEVNEALQLRLSEHAFYDTAVANNNDERKKKGLEKDDLESELEFRDAYLDYSSGAFDLRIGKQQIVWGDAISLFIADVANGIDLREYILPEFDLIRIPQWAADLSITHNIANLELFAAKPEFNKFAVQGSEFAFPLPAPSGVPTTTKDPTEPTGSDSADAGAKISRLVAGLDISAFALYTWEKSPIYFRTIDFSGFHFAPGYRRQNIFGLTLSKDFLWDSILKGEANLKPDSYYSTSDIADTDGVTRKDTFNYVVGLSRQYGPLDTNVQFSQKIISDAGDKLVNERPSSSLWTFWVKWPLLDKKLEPEYLVLTDPSRRDRLHRPKITLRFGDHIVTKLGADIFEGHPNQGHFGIFENKDRGYIEVEYHF